MNPLSTWTFYRRHRGDALLLTGPISLMTLGVCILVRVPDSIPEILAEADLLIRVSDGQIAGVKDRAFRKTREAML
ncbi:MAG: hypothetical protein PVH41_18830 [Anaerolineae bacterium]|jgi:hypothetical protein